MIVIMGPGRCGTTLIVRILQHMGYDTGGAHEIFREKRKEIRRQPRFKWPYVVKGTGTLCHGLNDWIREKGWDVEVVIFCVRNLEANIRSMIKKKKGHRLYRQDNVEDIIREEVIRTYAAAREQLKEGKFPHVEIEFPRSAQDMEYCYMVLSSAINGLDRDKFVSAWVSIVNPAKIRNG